MRIKISTISIKENLAVTIVTNSFIVRKLAGVNSENFGEF